MKLNTGGKFSGKTANMLKKALDCAAQGQEVIVVCASMREVFRLKKMTEDLAAPMPVPVSIKLVSKSALAVDLSEPAHPQVRGVSYNKLFIDHYVWETLEPRI